MSGAFDPGEDDVEWEYEYDDNQTEDFYLTLDLTTHVSNAVAAPEPRKRNRAAPKGKRRPETAAEQATRDEREPPIPAVTTATATRLPSLPATTAADGEDPIHPGTQDPKLQILDLHSENPYVKFIDGVYSCNWHTDLSTQVYVARPGVTATPLRPGHVVDVVGLSRHRLVGKPVTLQPRPKPVVVAQPEPEALGGGGGGGEGNDDPNNLSHATATTTTTTPPQTTAPPTSNDFPPIIRPGEPLHIPRDRIRTEAMQHQAAFLEQLSAIKLRRGETDLVPVSGVRYYDPPADREGIRARARADVVEAEREERDGGGEGEEGGGGDGDLPSAKRRRVGGLREGGGDDEDDEVGGGEGDGGGLRFRNQTVETFSSSSQQPKTKRSSIDGELQQQQQREQQQQQQEEEEEERRHAQPGATSSE